MKSIWLILGFILPLAVSTSNDVQTLDRDAEASCAFEQAMNTLSSLTTTSPFQAADPLTYVSTKRNPTLSSIFSSFTFNLQAWGPIASTVRIFAKLQAYVVGQVSDRLGKEGTKLRGRAIKVVDLLQKSAELGNMDALYTLAKISLLPPTLQFALDPKLAYDSFSAHATATGNATSQSFLAFFHATGYGNVVSVDQAKAQLYYTFAAKGGDKGAQMALGYRYRRGIGTKESCQEAMKWYEKAADQVIDKFRSGPPGGRTLPLTATPRLSELAAGIYGPDDSSVALTSIYTYRLPIKEGIAQAAGETWHDVLEYYQFSANRGEIDFMYRLGRIYYQGSIYFSPGGIASGGEGVGAIPRSYDLAHDYFEAIARQVWPTDPPNPANCEPDDKAPVGYAAASAGYLGRMYLRGEGVKANMALARMWFERGAYHGDRESNNGLGIMYRDGLIPGSKQNLTKALTYFTAAAGHELAEAQVNLGKYHYSIGDLAPAMTYFKAAVRHGSTFEAYYYLARAHSSQASESGHITSGSCAMAVSFYKLVVERGVWDDELLKEAESSWGTGTHEGKELAMVKWWIAAERGFEIAQNNLAHVHQKNRAPRFGWFSVWAGWFARLLVWGFDRFVV